MNPTLARMFLRSARRRALPPLETLRRVSIGSAGMTRGELRALLGIFPGVEAYFTYGLTEMGPRVSTFAAGSDRAPSALLAEEPHRSVPIGRPLRGVVCELVREGDTTRLAVASPYAASAEWVAGAPRPMPASAHGFVTQDGADLLPSGDLEVRGRADQTIITGGLNVYPEDIERAAMTVPGVAVACAVGLPSELYGEIVVLLCERDAATSTAALEAPLAEALRAALPPTHVPKEVRFVEALPRTPAGKVLRREARALAVAGMAS
jgi:acyl-CoA synthetase (AMP-forming)/AMP-acid ligase II